MKAIILVEGQGIKVKKGLIGSGEDVVANRYKNDWFEFDTNEDYESEWVETGYIRKFINIT